ncbi:MAG TPA: DUF6687 family protein [Candidatus Polarisedimenticolia bacterium]|nr:DUF6687 family protein [Candidatus Polarisedimenticolia bacterium]
MIFAYYHERLKEMPFLCVDGVVETGLNLSHWPGNRSPAHLKADTTTGMALKLARDPGRADWLKGISIVSNNHFDTDGLLSVFGVLRPEEALGHEAALLRAARTGDFGEFTTPEAFKLDAVVTAFDDDRRSPVAAEIRGLPEHERYQLLYDRLLALLPGLLTDASRYKDLWGNPLRSLMRSLMRIKDVARVREHEAARLTVIEATEELEPMARFNVARHHRVLTATRSSDGWIFEMAFQIFSWFETVTPPRGTRFDLSPVAAELDRLETSGAGAWTYTGNDSLESRLYRAGPDARPVPSSLALETVEGHLVRLFTARP